MTTEDAQIGNDGINILEVVEDATCELHELSDVLAVLLPEFERDQRDRTPVGGLYLVRRDIRRVMESLDELTDKMAQNRSQFRCVTVEPKAEPVPIRG